MRAFVTGGTGFVGGAVVRKLVEAGHEVRALVRPGTNTRQLDPLPVVRVEGDLGNAQPGNPDSGDQGLSIHLR